MRTRRVLEYCLARSRTLHRSVLQVRGRSSAEKLAFVGLLRSGDTVWDVGANFGYFTMLFSDLVGRDGRVHGFEPVPPTFLRLRDVVEGNAMVGNVRLHNVACSDVAGELLLHVPNGDSGQASLSADHRMGSWANSPAVTSYACRGIRLDEYDEIGGPAQVDLIKCDVEGAELPALRGALETLRQLQPMLWLEVSPDWTRSFGYTPEDLLGFLEKLGYNAFSLCGSSQGAPMKLLTTTEVLHQLETEPMLNLLAANSTKHRSRLASLHL